MKIPEKAEQTATIWIDDLAFQVWLSDTGVRRLGMPATDWPEATGREKGQSIRIDYKSGYSVRNEGVLKQLAAYLVDLLRGVPPAAYPKIDLRYLSTFTREVLEVVATIPWGESKSYGWIARQIQRPGAARAVGGAVARNPVPMLIPCHRVVRSDGSTGGWSGPPGWKEFLLAKEAQ